MSILVINYYKGNDWSAMLPELADQLVVLSENPIPNQDCLQYFEHIPNCESIPYPELRALDLMATTQFTNVLADNEYDLVRAGRLRDRWGIGGQTEKSAVAFRDKVIMKDYVSEKLKVPSYARIQNIFDLHDFIEKHGYPVIVKPIDQGASRGTTAIRNREDLLNFSKEPITNNLEIECFVAGGMYHVDALVEAGEILFISVSRYYNNCLAFQEGKSVGSIQLHPSDTMFQRLRMYLLDVLEALPAPPVAAYHLEVFHTPQDELVFCEIASRVGGGLIPNLLERTFQFPLKKSWMRRCLGLPIEPPLADPESLHGFLFLVPQSGILRKQPDSVEFDGVLEYKTFAEPGDALQGPMRSIDKMASLIIRGRSAEEIESKMAMIEEWFWSQVVIEAEESVPC